MKFKKPYIIAEISANHCGNFERAKKLIKCAKINGARCCKTSNLYPRHDDNKK